MGKGVVLEIQENQHLIVLTKGGEFLKLRYRKCKVGQQIAFFHFHHLDNKQFIDLSPKWIKSLQIAVIAALVFALFLPLNRDKAYAYVSVDMAPSIEFQINEDRQVIALTPLNKKGEELVTYMKSWKYDELKIVLQQMMKKTDELGFIQSEKPVILFTSTFLDEEVGDEIQEVKEAIERDIHQVTEGMSDKHEVNCHHVKAPLSLWKEAQRKGLSAGKFALYTGFPNSKDYHVDDWKEQSIRELVKHTGDIKEALDTEITADEWKEKTVNFTNRHKSSRLDPMVPTIDAVSVLGFSPALYTNRMSASLDDVILVKIKDTSSKTETSHKNNLTASEVLEKKVAAPSSQEYKTASKHTEPKIHSNYSNSEKSSPNTSKNVIKNIPPAPKAQKKEVQEAKTSKEKVNSPQDTKQKVFKHQEKEQQKTMVQKHEVEEKKEYKAKSQKAKEAKTFGPDINEKEPKVDRQRANESKSNAPETKEKTGNEQKPESRKSDKTEKVNSKLSEQGSKGKAEGKNHQNNRNNHK